MVSPARTTAAGYSKVPMHHVLNQHCGKSVATHSMADAHAATITHLSATVKQTTLFSATSFDENRAHLPHVPQGCKCVVKVPLLKNLFLKLQIIGTAGAVHWFRQNQHTVSPLCQNRAGSSADHATSDFGVPMALRQAGAGAAAPRVGLTSPHAAVIRSRYQESPPHPASQTLAS